MSDQYVSHVLVNLTGGVVLPVAVTFSLWLLGITVIQCVSRHDGWHLHPLSNRSLAHYCCSFSLLRGSKTACIPKPKPTQIIISSAMMYDLLSGRQVIRRPGMFGQYSGGNTSATSEATCWVRPRDLLRRPHDPRVITPAEYGWCSTFVAPCLIVSAIWSSYPIPETKAKFHGC